MKQIELSAGTIEYSDTGGDRPVLVLLPGLMMDVSLRDGPMADLSAGHRCVAPTLPLGAHRQAMRAGPDLSMPGIARLVAEFLDGLDLQDVTLEPKLLREAAGCLPGSNRPTLVVWASEDRVMPPEHGQRLAKLLPQGQLAEIEDSYTLIPLDQPARLAQVVREFTHAPRHITLRPEREVRACRRSRS